MQNNDSKKHICYHCGTNCNDSIKININQQDQKRLHPSDKSLIQLKHSYAVTFCCYGCSSAFQLINDIEGDYYRNRKTFSPKVEEASSSEESFNIIEHQAFSPEANFKKGTFILEGLHCASCVWLNEKILNDIDGISLAIVSYSTNELHLSWQPSKVHLFDIVKELNKLGYNLQPLKPNNQSQSDESLKKMVTAGFFTGNNMLISIALYAGYFGEMENLTKSFFHFLSLILTLPVIFYSGSSFFKRAWAGLKNKIIGMDLLLSTGISITFIYSTFVTLIYAKNPIYEVYFDSICFVTFAILIGRFIEEKIKQKALRLSNQMTSKLPKVCSKVKPTMKNDNINNILSNQESYCITIPVEELHQGDIIVVNPNEVIAIDGILKSSSALVDESVITGESLPIHKKTNCEVTSGAICLSKPCVIEVSKVAAESSISQIHHLVSDAMNKPPKTLKLTTTISKWFILIVLTSSLATFAINLFGLQQTLANSLIRTISMLIVACPCALNLAIPTAFASALQFCYKNNIIVKDGHFFELLARATHYVFDKTGTLTSGLLKLQDITNWKPQDKKWQKLSQYQQNIVMQLAQKLEKGIQSQHPIAIAINNVPLTFSTEKNLPNLSSFQSIDGVGVTSLNLKKFYFLGKLSFFPFHNYVKPNSSKILSQTYLLELDLEKLDKSNIALLKQWRSASELIQTLKKLHSYAAIYKLEFSAELRDHTKNFIQSLPQDKVSLLSGDTLSSVTYLAKELGVMHSYAEVNPHGKLEFINKLKSKKSIVIMTGDGINDSAALAVADVGVSFAEATKLSIYSSDILLLDNSFRSYELLLETAKKTKNIIRQNLMFSLLYNIAVLPLAFLGLLIPLTGSLLMASSSLVVLLNSVRIFQKKP